MTKSFLRPAIALALALSLAACGGGKATFPITGTISGLVYDDLVLSTNGMDLKVPAKATTFTFPNTLDYGEVYAVVQTKPPAHQNCEVVRGTETAGRLATISIEVYCTINTAIVGGTITGLKSAGLQLTNGSDPAVLTALAADTAFLMPNKVPYGSTYGITVLTQPATETCSVANGTGVTGDVAVTNIVVTCVPK
ncbi:hypothetical protein CR105_05070 [Massilia eurypsychrophila]|jgi:uncharacterized protein (UPF0179 family)|uniref:Lipoprotein n=1 Tax=Massilia eurypsychrophila TaxID=1485217 RepID=A0A2G8TK64_9BURK|nr:hypothetical protein [Massilia eurypsychrophila]PIL46440.1 hypothetical protein CR105_05070 [Massilia eurypsychrophila]